MTAYSGAQDFVLALLPWVVIMKLQMRKKEKVAVALAMSLGVLSVVTGLILPWNPANISKCWRDSSGQDHVPSELVEED